MVIWLIPSPLTVHVVYERPLRERIWKFKVCRCQVCQNQANGEFWGSRIKKNGRGLEKRPIFQGPARCPVFPLSTVSTHPDNVAKTFIFFYTFLPFLYSLLTDMALEKGLFTNYFDKLCQRGGFGYSNFKHY